jgi:hypothetical protein
MIPKVCKLQATDGKDITMAAAGRNDAATTLAVAAIIVFILAV